MRKRIGTAVAVALLAVGLGGVVRTGTAASAATSEITVVLPRDTLASTELDFRGNGLTRGDRVVFRGPLYNLRKTRRVGRVAGECVVVTKRITRTKGLWRCSYLLRLGGGDVIAEGLDPRGSGSSRFAVLGGTDVYRTVSGDAKFVDTANATVMHLRLEL